MSVGEQHGQSDLLHGQHLLARFSAFALQGEAAQGLLEQACRTAEAAWGAPAAIWQYFPTTRRFHLRAALRWPASGAEEPQADPDLASLLAGNQPSEQYGRVTVRPASWLREQGFHYVAGIILRGDRTAFGVLEVGIAHASAGAGDAAFLQSLANLLGLALERVAERDRLDQLLAAKDDQLREKDLMMQEVHHRVRNSLQLVHTLLTLQARALRSAEAKRQLEEAAGRIITIGAVHQRLYQGTSVVEGDVADYLRRVLDDLKDFADGTLDRRIEITTPALVLSADKLTPLGLMTAELVTNAVKYGRGAIRVAVEPVEDAIDITVEDEGPGFPADFSPARTSGLGMRIVSALSKAGRSAIRVDRTVPHGRITARLLLHPVKAPTV